MNSFVKRSEAIHSFKLLSKFFLLISILSLTVSILIIHNNYPIIIKANSGYFSQIPRYYWMFIFLSITSSAIGAFYSKRKILIIVFVYIAIISATLYEFYFFSLQGGDVVGVTNRLELLSGSSSFDQTDPFDYLQWPAFWTSYLINEKVLNTQLIRTIKISYYSLYYVFVLSIANIYYQRVNYSKASTKSIIFYSLCILYFALSFAWVNSQYVPQFFALILLAYIIGIHNKKGNRWLLCRVGLFLMLVLSHPMLFIFYLGSVWISLFLQAMENSSIIPSKRIYKIPLLLPTKVGYTRIHAAFEDIRSKWESEIVSSIILTSIYIVFFVYQFIIFQRSVISTFTAPVTGRTADSIYIIRQVLGVTGGTESSIQLNHQYYLESKLLYEFTYQASRVILITLFCALVLLFLYQKIENIDKFDISLLSMSSIYFVLGLLFNIIGSRALQILFIPLVVSMVALKDHKRIVFFITIISLTCFFFIPAYSLVNASVTGGGSYQDYYANEGGKTVANYTQNDTEIIKPQYTIHPLDNHHNTTNLGTVTLDYLSGEPYVSSSDSVIIYNNRFYYHMRYYEFQCDFNITEYNEKTYTNGFTHATSSDSHTIACT